MDEFPPPDRHADTGERLDTTAGMDRGDTDTARGTLVQAAQARDTAFAAAQEYQRALLQYGQIMRHRLANPLTVITVGIDTLIDLDLDQATRRRLLEAMRDQAAALEEVIFHPQPLDAVEGNLNPLPELTTENVKEQAVENEMHFRQQNEKLVAKLAGLDEGLLGVRAIELLCECSAIHCVALVTIPLTDYFRVNSEKNQFVIRPLHNLPDIEDVIEKHDGWWVVEK